MAMTHQGVAAIEVVTRFYEALARRDWTMAETCFAPDASWHLPGNSRIAGDHIGWTAIREDFLAQLGPLSGDSFRAALLDVAVGQHYVVAIQHATGARDDRGLDVTGCQLITFRDGLISAVRGHYSDQQALDAFWDAGS
ncbi:nuclear transport factor 2 family protein [Dactylosporangium sp. CA-233914]|uniref:nuclear transport factor 2 family protein n=1 Tax=Dactylosporangium sp. CA-233914 TaxID=3239934 RepID=UPI003D938E10